MAKSVLTKQDFVRRYANNEFGNHTRTWSNVDEFFRYWNSGGVDYRGVVYHLRNRVAGGPTYYDLHGLELAALYGKLRKEGHKRDQFYVSEMAPDCTIFQGEVMRDVGGLSLTFSLINAPMRAALAQQTLHAHGLQAKLLLEHYLDPGDYDWIMELLEEYNNPPHVIEFSHYAIPCGTLNRRCVIWECRGAY